MSGPLFSRPIPRRCFLQWGGAAVAASAVPARLLTAVQDLAAGMPARGPGSLPFPTRPAGVPQPDLAPELANIDHIIVVMMENHSFDNYFGMLPFEVRQLRHRVNGWPSLDATGTPRTAVPQRDAGGAVHTPFAMPDGCQPGAVSQAWDASHQAYDGGAMDGFVLGSSPSALGYWDQRLMPFYYSLASSFPVCDSYFSSTLCQTYPNRLFLMAGTAAGLVSTDTPPPTVTPKNGHIFQVLDHFAISWGDYYTNLPTPGLFGATWAAQQSGTHLFGPGGLPQTTIDTFAAKCRTGLLESVVLVEPDYEFGSEENPQNVQVGQTFVAGVVNALMSSPAWQRSLLVFTYDEHGGYYDHVAPPAALNPGDGTYPGRGYSPPRSINTYGDDYTRYGFRVPAVVVSPYARAGFTSHTTYDHTSILATIQRKWNLPALTYRDANANHLGECLVSHGAAPFGAPPALAAAPFRTEADTVLCETTGSDPNP
ncbi:MAG: hypothetical protein JOZ75_01705 [Candidatus Dormibacteraeota bacterium]|nr:hypothetical protein [Candidatus Dormibacteraeota bacterium]